MFEDDLQQSKPNEIYKEPEGQGYAAQRSSTKHEHLLFLQGETPQPNFEVRPGQKMGLIRQDSHAGMF